MTETNEHSVKILFRFFSDVLDEPVVETLWATRIDSDNGLYKIDSIPFYAPVASDDIVLAGYDDNEQMLTYRSTIEYSGNSLILVVLMDAVSDIDSIRDSFRQMGCITEKLNKMYFSMEVPVSTDYIPVKKQLIEFENKGAIGYKEHVLSDKHDYR